MVEGSPGDRFISDILEIKSVYKDRVTERGNGSGIAMLTCYGVEVHEILKVGDLSSLPGCRHVGRLEQLTRGCQGNVSVRSCIVR